MNRKWMKRSFGINLRLGTQIVGKWNKHTYTIVQRLGSGMIGSVYLCEHKGQYVALKISQQKLSMTKEVNVLKALGKAQDKFLGPSLFDVDDWIKNERESYSFYVMEYIKGEGLASFLRKKDRKWIGIIALQLLDQLHHLHKSGWVFGDLKADNILIEDDSFDARFIDVGGTTRIGRSIKEYTDFCDRGYWELGTRRAEPSYDLFALVMVFLSVYYPLHFKKEKQSLPLLEEKINRTPALRPFKTSFKKALKGEYRHASQMKRDIIKTLSRRKEKSKKPPVSIVESFAILTLALLFYVLTLFTF